MKRLRLYPGSVSDVLLAALTCGPVDVGIFRAIARGAANKPHTADVAVNRLLAGGLVACKVMLTGKGRARLKRRFE